jgi:hypothetical protein
MMLQIYQEKGGGENPHLNLSIVPLRDLLALNLLRRSDQSALGRPLVGSEHHALEHLDALESALLSGCVALLEHERLDLRFRAQIRERDVWIFLGERRTQVAFVRYDDRDGLR